MHNVKLFIVYACKKQAMFLLYYNTVVSLDVYAPPPSAYAHTHKHTLPKETQL